MSEYPSMYDAAIEYAKKGFAVFPLKYRDKVPLTRNGCKDATTDAAQIKAWWQKYPNANIGLATGSVSQNVCGNVCSSINRAGYFCKSRWSAGRLCGRTGKDFKKYESGS